MIYFSHPTGNANVRAALKGIADADLLSQFYTTVASFPGSLLYQTSYLPFLSEIRRRAYDVSLRPHTKSYPFHEIGRLLSSKAGFSRLIQHESGIFSIDRIYQQLDLKMAEKIRSAKDTIKAVYCYEDGAAFSFAAAKSKNIQCIYDLPIGYWRTARRLLEAEKERWPEWASTLTGFKNSEAKLKRKDDELGLADRIFVASSFTARTLGDYTGALSPVQIIPYGFPDVLNFREYSGLTNRKKLKLLFVGGLSQRKGIADLFEAVMGMENYVELTIVGKKTTAVCPALDIELNKHTWIPSLPHYQVLQLMLQQDLLVFPSLFEGFGLVITEAMSQGLPVITTDRTAGPDLIEHGKNGWLIEAGSTIALKQAIESFIQQPNKVAQLGREAQEAASKRPWTVYGLELAIAVANSICN